MFRPSLRAGAVVAASLLGSTLLAVAPAQAAIYSTSTLTRGVETTSCSGYTSTSDTTFPSTKTTLTPNAPATTSTYGGTRAWAESSTPTNTLSEQFAMRTTARTTTNGSSPGTVQLSFSGTYTLSAHGPQGCTPQPFADNENDFSFTTTRPLIATVHYQGSGSNYVTTGIENKVTSDEYADTYLEDLNGSGAATFYLPAGSYEGYIEGALYAHYMSNPGHLTASGSLSMSFAVAGSATSGPSGSAHSYVSMASARNCAASSLRTAITSNSALANSIAEVVYYVNGHLVKSLLFPAVKPGTVVNLRLGATSSATVVIHVDLKSAVHLIESAHYLECAL